MPSNATKHAGGAVWAGALAQLTAAGLTALGATQATAYPITADITQFTTVAASTGAVLPASPTPGEDYVVSNFGANALSLYPGLGGKANNGSANAAVSIPAGKTAHAYFGGAVGGWSVLISA